MVVEWSCFEFVSLSVGMDCRNLEESLDVSLEVSQIDAVVLKANFLVQDDHSLYSLGKLEVKDAEVLA